tara:strand:+ start:542 stop:1291 length:750 start_codon:yes stop_codon:yes gene_type:complete
LAGFDNSKLMQQQNYLALQAPQHVAIVMDGNGRWARKQGLPRLAGHRAGTENIRRVLRAFAAWGIPYVTIYAFSTENWGRPSAEVNGLLELMSSVIEQEVPILHHENVRLLHLGRRKNLSQPILDAIDSAVELTANNTGITLCTAFDYGGRSEILDALCEIYTNGVASGEVKEETLSSYLYLPEIPDPDLVIRTGGERRLSNFLLWQSAYSELYFTNTLWPDFNEISVEQALKDFKKRNRRFGKLQNEA